MGFARLPLDETNIKLGTESVSWPTTAATITDSYIDAEKDGENQISYVPRVKYSFKVGQEQRTGAQISYSRIMEHSSFDRGTADAIRGHYPSMSTHTVFYSPTDKNQAVLVPGFAIPEEPLPSIMMFVLAASFVLNIFLSILLLSRPTKLLQTIFSVAILASAFIAFFGCTEVQRHYLKSRIPQASMLRVATDGFFLGPKKFSY